MSDSFQTRSSSTKLAEKPRILTNADSFYITETGSNLVGQKGSPGLTQKLTNAENPDMTESMN
jgi:hypothetical protein